mgnify:FL=1
MTEAMNIYQSIQKVMSEVPAITKDKRNTQQGFNFRGIDDVMNHLSGVMANAGVFIVPEVLDTFREERTTKSGGNMIYTNLKTRFTFYAQDGSSVSAVVASEGMDSADKSTNKALSAGYKYACLQVFCIPTEELVDADATTPEESRKQKSAVSRQAEELKTAVKQAVKADSAGMTLEEAENVTTSDGKRYGDMSSETLSYVLNAMLKKLKEGVSIKEDSAIQRKIEAATMLLKTRNEATNAA